ncbi:MAG TPA: hypothetical protein VIU62_19195 [Chloroflexota bacterium]
MTMSLVIAQPGCQTCKAFGLTVGVAGAAETVVAAVDALLVVVAVLALAAEDVALAAAVLAAVLVVTALAAAELVAAAVVVVADVVVGATAVCVEVDTAAEAPQAARPTTARSWTLAVSAARRETRPGDHFEERMPTLLTHQYE